MQPVTDEASTVQSKVLKPEDITSLIKELIEIRDTVSKIEAFSKKVKRSQPCLK
jgi:hypothetical protein